jgi:hypothetical protein
LIYVNHRSLSLGQPFEQREAGMKTFPVLRFAAAAGLFLSLHAVVVTASALAGVPGMRPFAELLTQFYGPYG